MTTDITKAFSFISALAAFKVYNFEFDKDIDTTAESQDNDNDPIPKNNSFNSTDNNEIQNPVTSPEDSSNETQNTTRSNPSDINSSISHISVFYFEIHYLIILTIYIILTSYLDQFVENELYLFLISNLAGQVILGLYKKFKKVDFLRFKELIMYNELSKDLLTFT